MKTISLAACIVIILTGCTLKNNKTSQLDNKAKSVTNTAEVNTNTSCTKDSDCKIVVTGCDYCPPCVAYKLTDTKLIAVNNTYQRQCPPTPKDLMCPMCVTPISEALNPKNAVCIKNVCQKDL